MRVPWASFEHGKRRGSETMEQAMQASGHLYMQTNEVKNFVIHYARHADGTISEVERVATGGAG
jgi:hypothetical protein